MAHSNSSQPGFFAAFFGFKRMVSPFLIGLVYFLGLIAIIGCTAMALWKGPSSIGALQMLDLQGPMLIASYVAIVILGLLMILLWRFYCELLIVLFSIYNRLADIQNLLGNTAPSSPEPTATNPPLVTDLPTNPTLAESVGAHRAAVSEAGDNDPASRTRRRRR